MAYNDPAERARLRGEVRRFVGLCDSNEGLIQRADTLRVLARLATTAVPDRVANEIDARDAQRRLVMAAEDRAKALIADQIAAFVKAGGVSAIGHKNRMMEDWSNLTGPLGHLRTWASAKLAAAEQSLT